MSIKSVKYKKNSISTMKTLFDFTIGDRSSDGRILKNKQALSTTQVPSKLLFREKELRKIIHSFNYLIDGNLPSNMLVVGKTGVGKTATVLKAKSIVDPKLRDGRIIYTVAKNSIRETIPSLCEEFEVTIPRRGISISDMVNRFIRLLDGRPTILVIDEIDKLVLQEGANEVMYFFTRCGNACVVGISNVLNLIGIIRSGNFLDQRVMSSWNPRIILFKPYTPEQVREILSYRAGEALHLDAIDGETIEYLSQITVRMGGDMRYAIEILRIAATIAEEDGLSRITKEVVDRAIREHEMAFIQDSIASLSIPEKCLLFVLAKNNRMTVSDAYLMANEILMSCGYSGISHRRWQDYRANLELAGFVRLLRKGMGRGRGSEHYLELDPTADADLVLKTLSGEIQV